MTDLEITLLCAEAMDLQGFVSSLRMLKAGVSPTMASVYNPFIDDAQAMALVKKLELIILPVHGGWQVDFQLHAQSGGSARADHLNRAICECVAKMQASRDEESRDG